MTWVMCNGSRVWRMRDDDGSIECYVFPMSKDQRVKRFIVPGGDTIGICNYVDEEFLILLNHVKLGAIIHKRAFY